MPNVHFRGTMLYCCANGLIDRILLPDALSAPPEGTGSGTGMRHLDDSRAILHYGGIHTPRHPSVGPYHPFRNKRITITGADDTAPSCDTLHMIPRLEREIWRVEPSHKRSEVIVRGASGVVTNYIASRHFVYLGIDDIHDRVTFEFNTPVRIEVEGQPPIDLIGDGVAYVYNFDERLPNEGDLNEGDDTDEDIVVDHDFKWVYSLVKPRNGKSRKAATGGFLPAPVSTTSATTRKSMVTTIYISTCFPAVIDTDE